MPAWRMVYSVLDVPVIVGTFAGEATAGQAGEGGVGECGAGEVAVGVGVVVGVA